MAAMCPGDYQGRMTGRGRRGTSRGPSGLEGGSLGPVTQAFGLGYRVLPFQGELVYRQSAPVRAGAANVARREDVEMARTATVGTDQSPLPGRSSPTFQGESDAENGSEQNPSGLKGRDS